ncbi:MAG: hypothetical protein F6J93_20115 [Oscillatoria sp. SIO1A7]|nr:hypothetical protein [Oscillatoria sp. SIO1A7]
MGLIGPCDRQQNPASGYIALRTQGTDNFALSLLASNGKACAVRERVFAGESHDCRYSGSLS